ncbi:fasciclin domain-containing protein, partial [Lentzea sp. NPDC034063]
MNKTVRNTVLAVGAASLALFGAACGSGDTASSSGTSSSAAPTSTATSSAAMADPAKDLVGPGCADYAKQVPSGAGSVSGMAADPVAVAASNNPLLKTLVDAVSGKLNPKV